MPPTGVVASWHVEFGVRLACLACGSPGEQICTCTGSCRKLVMLDVSSKELYGGGWEGITNWAAVLLEGGVVLSL
jgi:hypothetical protein